MVGKGWVNGGSGDGETSGAEETGVEKKKGTRRR